LLATTVQAATRDPIPRKRATFISAADNAALSGARYGRVSCEHHGFAGTVGLRPETAAATWAEIGACVARAGIRKLILYNSHGGNHALAEVVARRLRLEHDMVVVLALNLGCLDSEVGDGEGCAVHEMFPADELRFGIHGGAVETSVMLHLRPDLVHMSRAQRFESSAAVLLKSSAASTSEIESSPPPPGEGGGEGGQKKSAGGAGASRPGLLQKHALGFGVKTGWLSQDLNPHGVVGDAADADAARGKTLVEAAAAGLTQLIVELHGTDAFNWTTGNVPLYPPQGPRK